MSRELSLEVQQVSAPAPVAPRAAKPAPVARETPETVRTARIAWTFWQNTIESKPSYDEADALDLAMYRGALRPVFEQIRDGFLSADFVRAPEGTYGIQGASDAIWAVTFYLRNQQYRPTPEALYTKVCEVLGLEKPRVLTGAEAEAQRQVSAPEEYRRRSEDEEFFIPAPPDGIDFEASWAQRFQQEFSKSDETYNLAMLSILGHLGNDAARERVMDGILADRNSIQRATAESVEDRKERMQARESRQSSLRNAARRMAEAAKERDGGNAREVFESAKKQFESEAA